jgi:hypothetical protein
MKPIMRTRAFAELDANMIDSELYFSEGIHVLQANIEAGQELHMPGVHLDRYIDVSTDCIHVCQFIKTLPCRTLSIRLRFSGTQLWSQAVTLPAYLHNARTLFHKHRG